MSSAFRRPGAVGTPAEPGAPAAPRAPRARVERRSHSAEVEPRPAPARAPAHAFNGPGAGLRRYHDDEPLPWERPGERDAGGLEFWVGPEPSMVRIGAHRTDQSVSTGFDRRLDDLDRLAALGARRIRMPLLWERIGADPERLDFGWADQRMERLRSLGLEPIVGLLHHGSGPSGTDLLDPAFPEKLAAYARRVAERYPWVRDWTPVNEPLTTARFGALYGMWHPHRRDDRSFVRALLQQVHAVRLAMQAIRDVVPGARLIQTEDLGLTHGTWRLASQVRFDNRRRWLSLDLLCGKVGAAHPLQKYLLASGAQRAELETLRRAPTVPDIVGINHYITSDRFLDHRLERYPPVTHGGNSVEPYADVEAVRVLGAGCGGFEPRLREAAQRYGRPVALTEVQMSCTREEQMRWLRDAWHAARRLRAEGIDVRAVTPWAAFGAHDWDSLLTQPRGHYMPGLFDVRGGGSPRATALAKLAGDLARGIEPTHPVLESPGWWQRRERLSYPAQGEPRAATVRGRPLLVVGRGRLGEVFARLCRERGLPYRWLGRYEIDLADPANVARVLSEVGPWAVVSAAGLIGIDAAEQDAARCRQHAIGAMNLGRACADAGLPLLGFSCDLVFDGRLRRPYCESDAAAPLSASGRAHHALERALTLPRALVVRTSALFGPWDRHGFLANGLESLRREEPWRAIADQTVSPTHLPDLAHACLDLLIDGETGLWHVANPGELSWYAFACGAAEEAGLSRSLIEAVDAASAGQRAARPTYSALGSERGVLLPDVQTALQRCVREAPSRLFEALPSAAFGGSTAAAMVR